MNEPKYKPTLCVGADVHKDEIVLRAVDKAQGHEVLKRFRVTNNLPGAQATAATLAQAATEGGYTRLEIGWESTGMLWIPFHRYLSTEPLLHPFELELICFNPKLVAKFKDGLVLRSPKNDDRDAFDIAARIRFGELPVTFVPGDFWQGLRRLTRYRYRLSKTLSQEKTRFQAYAFLKASDWKRVKPFSDILGATSAALLTEFTVADLQAMTHDQLVDLIKHRGRGRFADPTTTARAVRQALRTSYPIDPRMDEIVTDALAAIWDHIRYLKRSMKRLDKSMTPLKELADSGYPDGLRRADHAPEDLGIVPKKVQKRRADLSGFAFPSPPASLSRSLGRLGDPKSVNPPQIAHGR